jgi:CelD/BcsL family acetyltransferase involved in cellulose biosynthesis
VTAYPARQTASAPGQTATSRAIRIVHADNHDPRWLEFLATADPTLFQHPDWASLMEETYGFPARVALALRDETVLGGLPYSEVEDFRGRRRIAGAFADVCEPLGESAWPAIEQALTEDAVPWQIRSRAQPGPHAVESRQVAVHHVVDLPADAEEARRLCERKQRTEVRFALRAGLTARHLPDDEAVETFYGLHTQVRKDKHHLLPQSRTFFHALAQRYFPDRGFVLAAELDGAVVAAELLLVCGDTLYFKFIASAAAALSCKPNDFLLWKAIETAAELGLRRVDLGISEAETLIHFKRKYAGDGQPVFAGRYAQAVKPPHVVQMEESLRQLTIALTAPDVPLGTAQSAAEALYRFFV